MDERKEKFTPGDWSIAGFDSQYRSERDFGITTQSGQLVVESFGECHEHRHYNAALIATAPEMYHLLYKAQCCIDWLLHKTIDDPVYDESEETILQIKELLEKARGEK